ncbi:uncharacterized protein VP01_1029g4 [Puccinia sorghi]|uniref:Uncharacterized protein n=1 Tax=Puccinia sorghi TaxID=27349 RepID=A0A0L6VUM5_9BASI|nr:uncharacterized protein VP01_1029g4 [Puccinia sorghi]
MPSILITANENGRQENKQLSEEEESESFRLSYFDIKHRKGRETDKKVEDLRFLRRIYWLTSVQRILSCSGQIDQCGIQKKVESGCAHELEMIKIQHIVARDTSWNVSHPLTQPQPLSLPREILPPNPGCFGRPTTPLHPAPVSVNPLTQWTHSISALTTGQKNPAPAPASNPIVLSKPQPFNGTCGAAAEVITQQPGLSRTWTRSSTGNRWSLMNSSIILNPDSLITTTGTVLRWPCGTSAKLELCQPTRDFKFNQHTRTVGWANTPLMGLYQHSLKENIHLAVVMSTINFDSLQSMQAMALKAGQTIEGIQQGHPAPNPIPSTSTSTPPLTLM